MLRLILFAFIALFILTGTNFGKNLMADHNFLEEGKDLKENFISNEKFDMLGQDKIESQHDAGLADDEVELRHHDLGPMTDETSTDQQEELALTKDEAITRVLSEFSMTELVTMVDKVKNGLTEKEFEEMKTTLKHHFSAEEIEALKELGKNKIKEYFHSSDE
ncbi:hypothetical protein [Alkalihalobacterium chitinilyticum]|uniref:Uncharacterized protein n=1 Tax=Alkalihalobacterium chitinilyticum TaxID=2980103 RepID=A0ABT5VGJ0_9BACI|nr:hypothetical protein [Alkalihalobacterium chitinilyticum]MDE5414286.1 hypothetical protein [Alkalihalobacterium chitinilyticum]